MKLTATQKMIILATLGGFILGTFTGWALTEGAAGVKERVFVGIPVKEYVVVPTVVPQAPIEALELDPREKACSEAAVMLGVMDAASVKVNSLKLIATGISNRLICVVDARLERISNRPNSAPITLIGNVDMDKGSVQLINFDHQAARVGADAFIKIFADNAKGGLSATVNMHLHQKGINMPTTTNDMSGNKVINITPIEASKGVITFAGAVNDLLCHVTIIDPHSDQKAVDGAKGYGLFEPKDWKVSEVRCG